DISVPSCLVPSSSNLDENANQNLSNEKKTGELEFTAHSHLQKETEAQRENEPRVYPTPHKRQRTEQNRKYQRSPVYSMHQDSISETHLIWIPSDHESSL
ncbi:hypothetical protein DER46DRAFT_518113, partial [Fusarium sp. MPI-SDFR-AT-0072]